MNTDGDDSAEGPAFPLAVRLLATAIVLGAAGWAYAASDGLATSGWQPSAVAVVGGAALMVLWYLYWIWRSRVTVTPQGIRQTWMWNKQAMWKDVTHVKLIRIPGLDWIMAPRLVLRVAGQVGPVMFHVAEPDRLLGGLQEHLAHMRR